MATNNTIDEYRGDTIDITSNQLHCIKCGTLNEYPTNLKFSAKNTKQLDQQMMDFFKTFTNEKCDSTIKLLDEIKRKNNTAEKDQEIIRAAKNGNLKAVRRCVDLKININISNVAGYSAMHGAARCGHLEMIRYLLENKADVNLRTRQNCTPLHIAAQYGHTETVLLLMDSGAQINVLNKNKNTPLHLAAYNNHANVVSMLLVKRAKVNIINNLKETPIMCAKNEDVFLEFIYSNSINEAEKIDLLFKSIEQDWSTTLRKLINLSVNVNSKKADGTLDSPVIYATRHNRVNFVKILLEAGADVGYKNNFNETALNIAKYANHLSLVELLQKHTEKHGRFQVNVLRGQTAANLLSKLKPTGRKNFA